MSDNSFSVFVSYASVEQTDGADARPAALELLRELRVVAAMRDVTVAWSDDQEAVVEIAVTDEANVLTLSEQDTIETTLAAADLRAAFEAKGMTLWLSVDDDLDDVDDAESWGADALESDEPVDPDEADFDVAELDAAAEEQLDAPPVRVAAFSHRGPLGARLLAESTGVVVDYVESGSWSLWRYATTEPTDVLPPTKDEAPVIELNVVDGVADWIDVRLPGLGGFAVPFWPQAERDTQTVIDLDTITVPETREVYRRLIVEGDGTRDELTEIAARVPLDVETAHRALTPETLDGVIGSAARVRAFLEAFGVPDALIELALTESDASAADGTHRHQRIEPQGWARGIGEAIVGGYGETLPLTRRGRWDARLSRGLRANPLLAAALSVGELALGVFSTSRLRGGWKSIGILLIIDAVGDLIVSAVRRKRRR